MPTRKEDDALFGIDTSFITPIANSNTKRMVQYVNVQVEAARTLVALSEEWQDDSDTVYPHEAETIDATSFPSEVLAPTLTAEEYDDAQGPTSPEAEITEADFDFVTGPYSAQNGNIASNAPPLPAVDSIHGDDDGNIPETPPFYGGSDFNLYLHTQADDCEIPDLRSPTSPADTFDTRALSPEVIQNGYDSDSSTITVKPVVRAVSPSSNTSDEGAIEQGPSEYIYRSRSQVAQWTDAQRLQSSSFVSQAVHESSFAYGEASEMFNAEVEMSDAASSTGYTTDDELDGVQAQEDARAGEMSDYEDSDMASDGSVTPTPQSISNAGAHVTPAQNFEDSEDSVSDAPTPSSSYDGDSEMTDNDDSDETGQGEPAPDVFDWTNPSVPTFTRSGNHIDL